MLVGRPGLSPVMVGRASELDRLAALAATDDAPAVALIGGEAGVGKTRLVQELAARVPEAAIVAGQADPGALGRPFELLLDAAGARSGTTPIGTAVAQALDVVTDENRPMDERVTAAHDVVVELTRGRPTIVVFDDLHWADAQSVALFERLAEPGSGPVLLVGTYRPSALNRRVPLAQLVPRLERRRAVLHLHLERLSVADVASFLAAVYGTVPSYRVSEALHARTGGNPFFLEELLSAAAGADPEQLVAQPLPWSVGELVRSQLEELGPEERRIAETAAVLGRRVTFDVLSAVTGSSERELIGVLRALVAAGLLVETDDDVFSFRHELAREAIEADLLGREKRRLHEAALTALRATEPIDIAAVAHHAHGAGRYDEMVDAARAGALSYLSSGSTYQALELAELALTEVPDDPDLLEMAGRAAWLAGLPHDAMVHAEHLRDVARRIGDVEWESIALRQLVRLRWELDEVDAMQRGVADLMALLDRLPLGGGERGRAMCVLAQMEMLQDRTPDAVAWAERAIAYGTEHDLPVVRVWGECELGSSLMMRPDRAAEALERLARVADEAEALGQWVVMARALNNGARAEMFRPDAATARQVLTRMRMAAERAGFDTLSGPGYWEGLATLGEWEGDLEGARQALEDGLRTDRGALAANPYRIFQAGLALEADDLEEASRLVEELRPWAKSGTVWWHGLVVNLAAHRRDLAAARADLPALITAIERYGTEIQLRQDVGSALLRAGASPDEVRPLFTVGATQSPWTPLLAGQLAEAEGDLEGALDSYVEAMAEGTDRIRPAALSAAYMGAARCLLALGRTDEARAHTETAARLLSRWQGWRVEELRALQRRLGTGPAVEGPAALTPREREVVSLLAEGLSNAELADRLFISPKTVAVHVSNILAKLGMSSRTEVAAFAVREGF